MSWNSRVEHSIVRLGNMIQAYNLLHERTSIIYHYFDLLIGMTAGMITTITGILLSLPNYEENTDNGKTNKIIFLFVSVILNFTQQFLSLEKQSILHLQSANRYRSLYNNVCTQLSLYRKDRVDSQTYIINLTTEINNLIMSSPSINPFVTWSFYKTFKVNRINMPHNNEIEEIEVHDMNDRVEKIKYSFESDFLCQYIFYSFMHDFQKNCFIISNDNFRDRQSYIKLFVSTSVTLLIIDKNTKRKSKLQIDPTISKQVSKDIDKLHRCSIPKQNLSLII